MLQFSAPFAAGVLRSLPRPVRTIGGEGEELIRAPWSRPWWAGSAFEAVLWDALLQQGSTVVIRASRCCMDSVIGPSAQALLRVLALLQGLTPEVVMGRFEALTSTSIRGAGLWWARSNEGGELVVLLPPDSQVELQALLWQGPIGYALGLCRIYEPAIAVTNEPCRIRYRVRWPTRAGQCQGEARR